MAKSKDDFWWDGSGAAAVLRFVVGDRLLVLSFADELGHQDRILADRLFAGVRDEVQWHSAFDRFCAFASYCGRWHLACEPVRKAVRRAA